MESDGLSAIVSWRQVLDNAGHVLLQRGRPAPGEVVLRSLPHQSVLQAMALDAAVLVPISKAPEEEFRCRRFGWQQVHQGAHLVIPNVAMQLPSFRWSHAIKVNIELAISPIIAHVIQEVSKEQRISVNEVLACLGVRPKCAAVHQSVKHGVKLCQQRRFGRLEDLAAHIEAHPTSGPFCVLLSDVALLLQKLSLHIQLPPPLLQLGLRRSAADLEGRLSLLDVQENVLRSLHEMPLCQSQRLHGQIRLIHEARQLGRSHLGHCI
mmetsp:Transcript_94535/g.173999  ORF Transcript_94535/g.173999 Transcript_94535/m.173999 type:complete len:265 (-) Transcript_94535:19-813(-)